MVMRRVRNSALFPVFILSLWACDAGVLEPAEQDSEPSRAKSNNDVEAEGGEKDDTCVGAECDAPCEGDACEPACTGSESECNPEPDPDPEPTCGDNVCDASEDNFSCPQDCPSVVRCGDGTCSGGEDPVSCPADCMTDPDPDPDPDPEPVCDNNGVCSGDETAQNCPADCQQLGSVPGGDTSDPFPIDRGDEGSSTPGSYKGLPLRLFNTGEPTVTAVDGVIGVVCIGMSNAYRECKKYIETHASNMAINAQVEVVNCSVGSHALEKWIDPSQDHKLWDKCTGETLGAIRPDQVRVIYHKAANQFTGPNNTEAYPPYPAADSDYFNFYDNLEAFADRIKDKFVNVQAVYTTSRTFGGFSDKPGRGDPLSYEEGHALNQWLTDIGPTGMHNGMWFGWGGYIWAGECEEGTTSGGPNQNASGICYVRSDFASDGVHPAEGASNKIVSMIHDRFLEHAWYRAVP